MYVKFHFKGETPLKYKMEKEHAIWKNYTYEQLVNFSEDAFNRMWLEYVRENKNPRLMEMAKLERIGRKLELKIDLLLVKLNK